MRCGVSLCLLGGPMLSHFQRSAVGKPGAATATSGSSIINARIRQVILHVACGVLESCASASIS